MKTLDNLLTQKNFNIIMATAVLLILVLPVGIANIYLGFYKGESPCILCSHERHGMILIGILGLFILKYGAKIKYIASIFIVSFWFLLETVRHVGNHAQKDLGTGIGDIILGLHTPTWAFVVFVAVILFMSFMLFFIRSNNGLDTELVSKELIIKKDTPYVKGIFIVYMVLVSTNVYQIFMTDGPPPYGGVGTPARFTPNIVKASQYWDNERWWSHFIHGEISLFGANQGPSPYVPVENETKLVFKTDFAQSPMISNNLPLNILDTKELGFKAINAFKQGVAGGIAYDRENNEFAIISTGGAAYFTNSQFKEVKEFVTIDHVNGLSIPLSVDATYYGPGKLVSTAYNKMLWGVEKASKENINAKAQWKAFREIKGDLMPMFKGLKVPIVTTRAKKAYVLSLAKDPNSKYAYMISIATKKSPKVILLKYDTKDNMISEETILEFSSNAKLKDGAKVSDFYITGADIVNGKMLAISKNYNALLVINLQLKTIEDLYELPNIGDAHDIAIKDDKLYILSRSENKDKVFILNNPLH